MRRLITVVLMMMVVFVLAGPALACGFLVSANGAVRLGKTSTFVAWEEGIEHYITNFTFAGPVESFGSIVPLPAEPIEVVKAGDWILQRLEREVTPPGFDALRQEVAAGNAASVEVLLRTRIDSLDVVVLKGGGADVLDWVNDNGFNLPSGPATDISWSSTAAGLLTSWPPDSTPKPPNRISLSKATVSPCRSPSPPSDRGSRCTSSMGRCPIQLSSRPTSSC